jgi:hypothetical protein
MRGASITLIVRKISSIALIVTSIVTFVFGLGFMTNFYQLFYDGNSEMYEFYKNIQVLNNVVFDSSIYLVILALLQIPFDIQKKDVSIRGLVLVVISLFVHVSNSLVVFGQLTKYKALYVGMDLTGLDGYNVTTFPFEFAQSIFVTAIVLLVLILVTSTISVVGQYKGSRA